MAGKLPWVRTKTDKDGKYKFRGAVLQNYGFGGCAEVTARMMKDGKPMAGASGLAFISDDPFFDEARKQKNRLEGGEVIKIHPCDEIFGVVVASLTVKPVAGATIHAGGLYYHSDGYDDCNITTDKDGRFSINRVRCGMIGVEHTGYARRDVIPSANWREKKHNKLEIKLAPLVDTTIRFIDAHSGKAPLVPLEFSYGMEAPAGDGWTLKYSW